MRKITFFVRYKWSHTNEMLHQSIKYDSMINFFGTVTQAHVHGMMSIDISRNLPLICVIRQHK